MALPVTIVASGGLPVIDMALGRAGTPETVEPVVLTKAQRKTAIRYARQELNFSGASQTVAALERAVADYIAFLNEQQQADDDMEIAMIAILLAA